MNKLISDAVILAAIYIFSYFYVYCFEIGYAFYLISAKYSTRDDWQYRLCFVTGDVLSGVTDWVSSIEPAILAAYTKTHSSIRCYVIFVFVLIDNTNFSS